MPFDQRSLIHWEAWFPGGPRIPKKRIFLKNGKKSSKTQKLKNVCFVRQNQQKKTFFCAAIFDNFQTKMFKYETTFFHLFSPGILNL